jgi:uncharacterized membrane protein
VTRIEIDYRIDGVMQTDTVETSGQHNAGIVSDAGRGYVHVPGEQRMYRRIERIVVRYDPDRGGAR